MCDRIKAHPCHSVKRGLTFVLCSRSVPFHVARTYTAHVWQSCVIQAGMPFGQYQLFNMLLRILARFRRACRLSKAERRSDSPVTDFSTIHLEKTDGIRRGHSNKRRGIVMEGDLSRPAPPAFLSGGGEMGKRIRAYDWAQSALGPPESWPNVLQALVNVLLGSSQAMHIAWGSEHTLLYNDAYARILGSRHPHALGGSL